MADAGMTVNYALNQIMNDEARTRSLAALASGCQALDRPALLIQGEADPRPLAACTR
jgi:hypothetical protein